MKIESGSDRRSSPRLSSGEMVTTVCNLSSRVNFPISAEMPEYAWTTPAMTSVSDSPLTSCECLVNSALTSFLIGSESRSAFPTSSPQLATSYPVWGIDAPRKTTSIMPGASGISKSFTSWSTWASSLTDLIASSSVTGSNLRFFSSIISKSRNFESSLRTSW